MTQAAVTVEQLVFGDMNGPLAYWGPVSASPTAAFTATERALLTKVAARRTPTPATLPAAPVRVARG